MSSPTPEGGAETPVARFGLSFELSAAPSSWRLEEVDVPETPLHDAIIALLQLVLERHAKVEGRDALVCGNLACRWDPSDARVGTDPDLVWVEPRPPGGETLPSLRIWEPEHTPPRVAVEVVSAHDPDKDYLEAPLRCARLGATELWVFDPERLGPELTGGPHLIQVWRLAESADGPRMRRVYAGDGPAYSEFFGAWLLVTDDGRRLRLAAGPAGPLWPTEAEAERARADAAEAELRRLRRQLGHDGEPGTD